MKKIKLLMILISAIVFTAVAFAGPNEDLLNAALRNNLAGVQNALSRGANVNSVDQIGRTALMIAAQNNDIAITKILVNSRANVNARTNFGDTALMFAAEAGSLEILRILINSRADINVRNYQGCPCPVHEDSSRAIAGNTALIFAADGAKIEAVKILINAGADVNIRNSAGQTALFWATTRREQAIINLLNQAGARVESNNRRTPPPGMVERRVRSR